jgi:DNA-binding ferritin-like protein
MNFVAMQQTEAEVIVADADYFRVKARQWFRLARQAKDNGTAEIRRDIARSFERQADALIENGHRFG